MAKFKTLFNRREVLLAGAATLLPLPALAIENTGVILVGASWCSVCKQAAPILALLSEQGQFPVLVASHDARPIPPFPDVVSSLENPLTSDITTFPVTMVYASAQNAVVGRVDGFRNPKWYMRAVASMINQAEAGQG